MVHRETVIEIQGKLKNKTKNVQLKIVPPSEEAVIFVEFRFVDV